MEFEDPRDQRRDTEEDQHKAKEHDKPVKEDENDAADGTYRYSDWASI
ncbi:MAG: hypothetical protein ACC646_08075 [Paracoccaceae bacterium]